MKKTLRCGNLLLESEKAKVCVPVVGDNRNEIIYQLKEVKKMNPDLVEWRVDYYLRENACATADEIKMILGDVDSILEGIPLIFTMRSKNEGGKAVISNEKYAYYCKIVAEAAKKCNVALIDVEKSRDNAKDIVGKIHQFGVKVIVSCHNFEKTPETDQMVLMLEEMEKMGGDVCKLAVMPTDKYDVQNLIDASKKADDKIDAPIVTMSMGELGAVTRVALRLTHSVITFAGGVEQSAPGQPDCFVVKKLLDFGIGFDMPGNIYLIGFMGTGKTTISNALSRITGLEEIDTDQYIEKEEGMPISDIFEKYGEEAFRKMETRVLLTLAKSGGKIVSCGGGTALKDENVAILKKSGAVVLLFANPNTIFDRVKGHTTRPILNDDMSLSHVEALLEEREPKYEKASDIKICVDKSDRVSACYEILTKLEKGGWLTPLR